MYTTNKLTKISMNRLTKKYRCMNCSTEIINPEGSMYNKRFCSTKCFDNYLEK
ncbi:MAG: hypothetical protein ABIH20_00490 [Candidatus Diapherotrites archaeon]